MATAASLNIVNSYYQAILRYQPSASLAQVYAAQLDAGTLSANQLEAELLSAAQSSTIPALLTYDLFYNATPTSGGLTYLTNYATALESGNYTYNSAGVFQVGTTNGQYSSVQFSLQNVYVNLGASFASDPKSTFAATYGSLSEAAFINQIYTQIFGSGPAASTQQYLLNNFQYYINYAGSTIGGYGAMAGVLLSLASPSNAGSYPAAANAFLTAAAISTAAGADTAKYGTELIAGYGSATSSVATLTAGVDNVTANVINADLSPYSFNGVGPTLNTGDKITGIAGVTNNTLNINDAYGTGTDVIPAGVTISNVQTINLTTQGNAGGSVAQPQGGGGAESGVFDATTSASTQASTISGVKAVNIISAGAGVDNVRVDPGSVNPVNVTVNHQHVGGAGGVKVLGGNNITVTDGDGLLNNGGDAGVTIGSATVVNSNNINLNPTGTITVSEIGNNPILSYGGTTVNISNAGGGAIQVGAPTGGQLAYPSDEPTGAVTITDNADAQAGAIAVFGSAPITNNGTTIANASSATITETALLAGAITIGAVNKVGGINQSYSPSGNDTVTVTAGIPVAYDFVGKAQSGYTAALQPITVIGGAAVNVTTNANSVVVGDNIVNGATVVTGENPSGNVTVADTAVVGVGAGGAGVTVWGGQNVNITNAGGAVTVGGAAAGLPTLTIAPTGTISVTDTAPLPYDDVFNTGTFRNVAVQGGTTVNITTNAGGVSVGTAAGVAGSEPTGAVTVVDTASPGVNAGGDAPGTDVPITIFGGTTISATSANGAIIVGAGTAASNPTGNVTTVMKGIETGGQFASTTTVNGGVNVNVSTTGGSVIVGGSNGLKATTPVTGNVSITDTFAGTQNADSFTVVGGASSSSTTPAVAITTTKTSGPITVGAIAPTLNVAGTALSNASAFANGNVSIVNETKAGTGVAGSTNLWGTGASIVNTVGTLATTVSIAGGGAATITDEETTKATGGAGAGKAIGASTLATVILDHVGTGGSSSAITSDALTALTVTDDTAGDNYTVNETPAHALALTVGADAAKGKTTLVTDATATSVTVTDNGSATAGTVAISAAKATSATFNTTASLNANLAGDAALTSITLANAAGASLNLGDLTGASVAITAGASSAGNVTIANLNGATSSFSAGNSTGVDTVSLSSNTVSKTIAGSSNSGNVIVANYAASANDVALNGEAIHNFSTLAVGANATSTAGNYDATGFNTLMVGQTGGQITFANVGANETLDVAANPNNPVTLNTTAAANTLTLNVGTDGLAATPVTMAVNTINTQTINVADFGQAGSTKNSLTLSDAALKSLVFSGDESVTVTDPGVTSLTSAVASINATNTTNAPGSTNTVDASGVAAAITGVTVTGGAGVIKATGVQGVDTQKDTVTLSGGFAVGEVVTVFITTKLPNGALGVVGFPVSYTVQASDVNPTNAAATQQAVANGLAAQINVAPPFLGITASASNGVLSLVGSSAIASFAETASVQNPTAALFLTSSTPGLNAGQQVETVTVNAVTTGETFIVTINGTNYAVTAGAVPATAGIATALAAAIIGGAPPGVTINYTAGNSFFTITANTAGTAFTSSVVASGFTGDISQSPTAPNLLATPKVDTVTVSGGFGVGDVVTETIAGTSVSYAVQASDVVPANIATTDANVAFGLATAINANITASAIVTASESNGVITVTAKTPGPAGFTDVVTPAPVISAVATDNGLVGSGNTYTAATDTYVSGAGGAMFTLGAGGGYNPYTVNAVNTGSPPTLSKYLGVFNSGYEQVNLSQSVAVSDTLNIGRDVISTFNGVNGGVTAFQAVASTAADKLNLTDPNHYTELANATTTKFDFTNANLANMAAALDPSGALTTALANTSYTVSNGVITIVGAGNNAGVTDATKLAAAELIVAQAAAAAGGQAQLYGTGISAMFTSSAGNTYVVSAALDNAFYNFRAVAQAGTTGLTTNSSDPGISVVELRGVSSANGFGSSSTNSGTTAGLGAQGAVLANVQNVSANSAVVAGQSKTFNDAGFALDQMNVAPGSLQTTTFTNLAPAAELMINAAGPVGNVVTSQTGASGSNSLIVDLAGAATVNTLTVNGDWATRLVADNNATINSFVDASNILTTLQLNGAGNLTIGGISDTAIATIDASTMTGALILGSAGAAISTNGLTIKGALGGDTIFASGSDTITVGSATAAITGAVNITATANGDVVTLTNEQNGSINNLNVGGVGDKISVDMGTNNISGGAVIAPTLANPLGLTVPLQSNDVFNLADGGTDNVWVGANATINLTGNTILNTTAFGTTGGAANIQVTGDTTGTTSAGFATGGGGAFTTITGADTAVGSPVSLTFLNATTEALAGGLAASAFVNVQGASSLSAALDTDVNQSLLLDAQIQPGANTSVVAGGLDLNANTGLLSWFQFSGNTYVVEAVNSSTSSPAAHVGLGTSDTVVQLAGLVDLSHTTLNNGVLSHV